jgi:hypothetical protein
MKQVWRNRRERPALEPEPSPAPTNIHGGCLTCPPRPRHHLTKPEYDGLVVLHGYPKGVALIEGDGHV